MVVYSPSSILTLITSIRQCLITLQMNITRVHSEKRLVPGKTQFRIGKYSQRYIHIHVRNVKQEVLKIDSE